jgi:hypothetical protein
MFVFCAAERDRNEFTQMEIGLGGSTLRQDLGANACEFVLQRPNKGGLKSAHVAPGVRWLQLDGWSAAKRSPRRDGGGDLGRTLGSPALQPSPSSGCGKPRLDARAPPPRLLSPARASSGLGPGSGFPQPWRFRRSPADAVVNQPPPPKAGGGAGDARARGPAAATPGPRPQLDRPPPARRRGLNAVNPSIKPPAALPTPRAPPAGPAFCLARPGPGKPGRAAPGSWGARRVPTRGRGGLEASAPGCSPWCVLAPLI